MYDFRVGIWENGAWEQVLLTAAVRRSGPDLLMQTSETLAVRIAYHEFELSRSTADTSRALRPVAAIEGDVVAGRIERLRYVKDRWQEVLPSAVLRDVAERLLRVHPLRAVDSLQLAAAIIAAER